VSDAEFRGGVLKLRNRLKALQATLAIPVLTEEIGQLLLRRTLARFDREVDPNEVPWTPLASETLERRKRAGGNSGKKILVQTGALRASIQLLRGANTGTISTNTGAGVRIGVEDPEQTMKAFVHNKGYGKIPMRKFLGIGKLDIRSVDGLMRRRAAAAEIAQ